MASELQLRGITIQRINTLTDGSSIDSVIESIIEAMTITCQSHCGKSGRPRVTSFCWTNELDELQTRVKRAKKIISSKHRQQLVVTAAYLDRPITARDEYKRKIGTTARATFRNYVGNVDSRNKWQLLRQLVKTQEHQIMQARMHFNGHWSSDELDTKQNQLTKVLSARG